MFSIWVSSYWLLLPYLLKSHLLKKEILLLIVISKSLAWRYFMSWTFAWCSSKNAIQIHALSKSVGTSWNSSKWHSEKAHRDYPAQVKPLCLHKQTKGRRHIILCEETTRKKQKHTSFTLLYSQLRTIIFSVSLFACVRSPPPKPCFCV